MRAMGWWVAAALLWPGLALRATEPVALSAEEFLGKVRQAPREESWAQMSGVVEHRRRGRETVEVPLYLGVRFTPERILAQVVADGRESYRIGQVVAASSGGTTVIAENGANSAATRLGELGLRPEDLTLSFIYWEFERELATERLRTRSCRVLQLRAPDGRAEWVRVAFCVEALFPLRVEWFRDTPEDRPYRTIEITSFRREADFWLVDGLSLQGPGWRSRITFTECAAGRVAEGIPGDLFRKVE